MRKAEKMHYAVRKSEGVIYSIYSMSSLNDLSHKLLHSHKVGSVLKNQTFGHVLLRHLLLL